MMIIKCKKTNQENYLFFDNLEKVFEFKQAIKIGNENTDLKISISAIYKLEEV